MITMLVGVCITLANGFGVVALRSYFSESRLLLIGIGDLFVTFLVMTFFSRLWMVVIIMPGQMCIPKCVNFNKINIRIAFRYGTRYESARHCVRQSVDGSCTCRRSWHSARFQSFIECTRTNAIAVDRRSSARICRICVFRLYRCYVLAGRWRTLDHIC